MKRGTRHKPPASGKSKPFVKLKPIRDRRIILLDDAPLRKRAAKEYKRTMAKLEAARGELRRFETEDRPAFGQWLAGKFGELLTKLRENAHLIHEQETLIEEVEFEMIWSGRRNSRQAYAAVMKRRENPEQEDDFETQSTGRNAKDSSKKRKPQDPFDYPGDDEDDEYFDPFEEADAELPEEERRMMFNDFLKTVFGIKPHQIPKVEYEQMFAKFSGNMFNDKTKDNPFVAYDEDKRSNDTRGKMRIKEIYRILVRRLHPDLQSNGEVQVTAIWYDVQEAYEARNLDRLETLLALTEMTNGTNGDKVSLGQMRGVIQELRRALHAVQRSIREAKCDQAWAFTKKKDLTSLEKSIRRDMEADLTKQHRTIAYLKRTLNDWSRPWKSSKRKFKKKS